MKMNLIENWGKFLRINGKMWDDDCLPENEKKSIIIMYFLKKMYIDDIIIRIRVWEAEGWEQQERGIFWGWQIKS